MTDPTPDVPTLRRLLAEATPGPWKAGRRADSVVSHYVEPEGIAHDLSGLIDWMGPADAALIVAAVNALPGILDRLEAAEGAVARVEALADEWDAQERVWPTGFNLRTALAEVTP